MTGSDCSLAGEWPALRARTRCRRTGFLVGPLGGALDPLVGRCWAMVPLDLHLCLVKPHPRASARCVTYISVRAFWGSGGVRSRRRPGPLVRSRHKLRDGRPAARSRTDQWSQATEEYTGGTLFCFWFVLARTPVANVELLGCKPFSFEVRTWLKASPCRSVPFLGSRAVVPLSESFQISFAIPNPPSRGLHSWRFMPPVCTGAVLVAGSHTLAGE